ncbi:MAG: hypothetical protein NVS4B3_14480 [Gemmatimonadaceae bacterium]
MHATLAAAAVTGLDVSPAGEWLLDNFYVVREQAAEIQATLPTDYYHELPKLTGPSVLAGYPRIYEIALELIAHSDGQLDPPSVELMVREYQTVQPLTIGELWAVPAMLRMGFLENIRRMSVRTARDIADIEEADRAVTRLIGADGSTDRALGQALAAFVRRPPELTPAFLTRFLQQMRSRRADFTPLLWLEQWIAEDAMTVEEAVQRSTRQLALTQHVMANSIASLRAVGGVDWPAFVEAASATERVLRGDPAGIYPAMTFETRDRFRHVVEELAKRSAYPEVEVARSSVAAAAAASVLGRTGGPDENSRRRSHVGYFLIGDGRPELERAIGYQPRLAARLGEFARRRPTTVYLASLATMTAAALALLVHPLQGAGGWAALAACCLALLPATDMAAAVVNQLAVLAMPPSRLPRLDFADGVPTEDRTIVVIPLLITSVAAVRDALDHLEAQYLANIDAEIRFAVLGDFADASAASVAGDDDITRAAIDGVKTLNEHYDSQPFYFFHRPRQWNPAEGVWMGRERKRGKLSDFNALLTLGQSDPFSIREGEMPWLDSVRYVITLDADTVLPRGAAAALIGTIAHPLNRGEFDPRRGHVVRGYGILQPRVSVSLSSANASRWAAIFAGHPGVDPYTTAVSDLYQDLFGEGTFTGKGIYDLRLFEQATRGRFPENALLSHDLIEGAFARAGLVTDVEVFDDYPARYLTASRRAHRWIRGDWQLLPWLFPRIPSSQGATANLLSTVSRWKILDNMRRSLIPVALLTWLTAGLTFLPGARWGWIAAVVAALVAPWFVAVIVALFRPPRGQAWRPYYLAVGQDAASAAQQMVLAAVLLPQQAFVAVDAIVRTVVRLFLTRRHLLEWQTASQAERVTKHERRATWRRMWPGVVLGAVVVTLVAAQGARTDPATPPLAWLALTVLAAAWTAAPELVFWLGAPRIQANLILSERERATTIKYARAHWEYFAHFVGPQTHWLVPDNFQETPEEVVATRTSPTNIGLQLLATMSARDLGWISTADMLDRLERAFDSLDRMARLRGHFFNWYDLADLRVLEPPYVSSVDSGNLAGHLLALAEGCLALASEPASPTARLEDLAARARAMAEGMDFRLFYDGRRKLLAIGYDVRAGKLDGSSYDLLASEARLASFVAIAKGDLPAEHWFRLGRSLTSAEGGTALVSWSGSMFEYLMPVLVMPSRPFSLLDQTHRAAVRRHIAYARARGVPWGISESAYNVRDRHETYQYRAFGVPDLGIKRGLALNVVVAPYASALALAVAPREALRNLAALEREGALGTFGFRDALDYTRPDPGASRAIVRTFMAHHLGMSLVAFHNALDLVGGEGIWQRRFMAEPLVRATTLLLDERVPRRYAPRPPQSDATDYVPGRTARVAAVVREFDTADTAEPRINVLGGPAYSVLLTNAGGGYSRSNGLDVFRWRADPTRDNTGQSVYVRDVTSGNVWSVAHQPTGVHAASYHVAFATDRVVYTRSDGPIDTRTEIVVVPSERTEVRRVTVTNRSRALRELELTSYGEVVLNEPNADRAHPAFQNLFVETEWVPSASAILASRRPRSSAERRPWCAHIVATGPEQVGEPSCETDRARFLGRGRTPRRPRALDSGVQLSGTVGAVLDPIAALRVRIRLEAGRSGTVAFTSVVADSREGALQYVDRYRDLRAADRAVSLAWTEAQIELRDLDVTPDEAALFHELAGALVYPHEALRATEPERATNRAGQAALWAHGISGDWPIVLATIRDDAGLPSVRQLLVAHKYWRMKGVKSDLVILNAKAPSYVQELQDQLMAMTMASSEGGLLEVPGGVFVRRTDVLSATDVGLLRAVASIHVVCDGVGLGDVVEATRRTATPRPQTALLAPRPPAPRAAAAAPMSATAPTQTPPRTANGCGQLMSSDDYEIYVDGPRVPPAPWANVVANPNAGFCVTERGGGFAWVENSQFFRLTPWFNDPVSDPLGEVLYLQDVDSGATWTATPGPTPARDVHGGLYTVRHAAGVTTFDHERDGVASHLALAMPETDPVKISRLRLTNRGASPRRIALTSYVEWALGSDPQHTRHHIHTVLDQATGAIFAQNAYTPDFESRVGFSWISEPVASWTAHRAAFIGRNGDLAAPAGLAIDPLPGTAGAGIDPCAALRCMMSLAPGETREIVVLLGAASNEDEARAIIGRVGPPPTAARRAGAAIDAWNTRLGVITARTPSREFDAMINRWSLYQALSCRMWARSALYQSSGAYGFRDQLQDCLAFLYAEPAVARAHLLRSAGRQFREGDVQHWWHEPSGRGIRTRFSDDLIWLPFVADHYVTVTGDAHIWDATAPYLTMRGLAPGEQEAYDLPTLSGEEGSLYEHCVRALDRACTEGVHGLPLMGCGDWNDGMNRVGVEGQGESIWLAWFLVATLRRFAGHAERREDAAVADRFRARATAYAASVERNGWDGGWYRRAYFDDGTPLGSAASDECRIDAIAQSWAVISGAGDATRARQAMQAAQRELVRDDARIVLLLAPPFDHTPKDPGYIKGYVPGVRENGAQYTHAALWTALATLGLGEGTLGFKLLQMLNPLSHTRTVDNTETYKVEPYVVCADVYNAVGHVGRGGWTWYTGSASWSYRVALEGVLGFRKQGDQLTFDPCVPNDWREFAVDYRFGKTRYAIAFHNPTAVARGVTTVTLDGAPCDRNIVELRDDGADHAVVVTLGEYANTGARV